MNREELEQYYEKIKKNIEDVLLYYCGEENIGDTLSKKMEVIPYESLTEKDMVYAVAYLMNFGCNLSEINKIANNGQYGYFIPLFDAYIKVINKMYPQFDPIKCIEDYNHHVKSIMKL